MAWIELHQDVPAHRKTLALADALDLPEYAAVGLVSCLWLWAVDNADPETGEIRASARSLSRAIRWDGDPEKLASALVQSEYIQATESGFLIPNWDRYTGKLLDQRAANAERQRRHREAKKAETRTSPDTNNAPEEHVTVTSQSRNAATVPNSTEPTVTLPLPEEGAGRGVDAQVAGELVDASISPEKKQTSPKGHRLPEGWLPRAEDVHAMRARYPDASTEWFKCETEKFSDHWRAQPGQRGVKTDWPAVWRNWIRTADERRPRVPLPKAGARPRQGESVAEAAAALDDDFRALEESYEARVLA